jgi:hypothetical protein
MSHEETRDNSIAHCSWLMAQSQLSLRYSRLRMASRRAALAPLSVFSGSADFTRASASCSLHDGQRLANPGFPGFSSNSSPQTTHVLIGKVGILAYILSRSQAACSRNETALEISPSKPLFLMSLEAMLSTWACGKAARYPIKVTGEGSNPFRSTSLWRESSLRTSGGFADGVRLSSK